jgi:zinc protease
MKNIFLFLSGVLLLQPFAFSQQNLPVDDEVTIGKLDNGLTYYVRRNSKPENRVELRLAINVGSMQENDAQQGLAHFTEHMAFNGTKNFKKNELVNYLQSVGVKFGAHLNAYTSFEETVYELYMPTDDDEIINQGFQILEDWAHNLTFDHQEIDNERGVVIEEWRVRDQGARARISEKTREKLLEGSRYIERFPIGKKEILETFDYQTLKNFYNKWYRPDLMAVVVVGDIDKEAMINKIKAQFSSIPTPAADVKPVRYRVPDHEETKVVVATDPEETFNRIIIDHKSNPLKEKTESDLRKSIVYRLASGMLTNRLEEYTQSAEPPFVYAGAFYSNIVRAKSTFQVTAVTPEKGIESGLQVLMEECKRVDDFGFTRSELNQFSKTLLASYERAFNERDKTESSRYASQYVSNFLVGDAIPGIGYTYDFVKNNLSKISLEEVNKAVKNLLLQQNRVVTIIAPEKKNVNVPDKEEVKSIIARVDEQPLTAYEDKELASSLINELPQPGSIVETKTLEQLGVTTFTLSNGMKVVLKPTDFKDDEILIKLESDGGHSLYPMEDFYSASFADGIVNASGIGDFSRLDLQKFLADKNVRLSTYIRETEEGMNGGSSLKDIETLFQLVHLYFSEPRRDTVAFQSFMNKNKALYENLLSNPQYYYSDKVSRILTNNHPRGGGFPSSEDFNQVNFSRALEIYRERFGAPSDFTFTMVGSFSTDSVKGLVNQYLGSLQGEDKNEKWRDLGIRPPEGTIVETIRKGADQQSRVSLFFNGQAEYNRDKAFALNSLVQALNIKLIEEIREKRSGVYGISANATFGQRPVDSYRMSISFPCAPENVDTLTAAVFDELEKMIKNGPTEEDIEKVKQAQRRDRETNLESNSYWLSTLSGYFTAPDEPDPLEILSFEKRQEKLSKAYLQEIASEFITPNEYIEVVLYPENGDYNDR